MHRQNLEYFQALSLITTDPISQAILQPPDTSWYQLMTPDMSVWWVQLCTSANQHRPINRCSRYDS